MKHEAHEHLFLGAVPSPQLKPDWADVVRRSNVASVRRRGAVLTAAVLLVVAVPALGFGAMKVLKDPPRTLHASGHSDALNLSATFRARRLPTFHPLSQTQRRRVFGGVGWSLKTDRQLPRSAVVYLTVRGRKIPVCGPCRSLHGFLTRPALWLLLSSAASKHSAFVVVVADGGSLRLAVER